MGCTVSPTISFNYIDIISDISIDILKCLIIRLPKHLIGGLKMMGNNLLP